MFILASLTAEPCVFKTEAKESLKLKMLTELLCLMNGGVTACWLDYVLVRTRLHR